MINIGQKFPEFNLVGVAGGNINNFNIENVFLRYNKKQFNKKWLVAFFYPKDFTFVCPTEIAALGNSISEFKKRNTEIIAGSIDSEFVHWAWRKQNPDLQNLPFPLISDIKRQLSSDLGILDEAEGIMQRATFIVDMQGIIKYIGVYDMKVGRSSNEILRTLDALQTNQFCPCDWKKGEDTINIVAD